ncbi:MAG TPA: hypothetical protein IAC14_11960 [Candidatus Scybalomonas excrementigallinarum]|nr:hypothetical protein [Candidatus Scybalomonas excrementigallinarum]
MTDYRRIVSYLYKYERGRKGENAGYVKIDIRKGRLKLLVHAQDPKCLKDKEFQVYFYYHESGKLIGVPSGTMRFYEEESEFRKETDEKNMFQSSIPFERMGGVIVYYNGELAYGTEWDDNPIAIGKLETDRKQEQESVKTPEPNEGNEEKKEREEKLVPTLIKEKEEKDRISVRNNENVIRPSVEKPEQKIEPEKENTPMKQVEEREKESETGKRLYSSRDLDVPMDSEYPLGMSESKFVEESRPMEVSSLQKIEEEQEDESKLENSGDSLVVGQNIDSKIKGKYIERKNVTKNVENSEQSEKIIEIPGLILDHEIFLGLQSIYSGKDQEKMSVSQQRETQETRQTDLEYQKVEEKARDRINFPPQQQKEKQETPREIDRTRALLNESPKIEYPNHPHILEMARIHPQDIGKLEISNWHYGSNSFLVHGYYEHQYIVLGRIRRRDNEVDNVLGVPGVYTNQEKYMATQFGFKEFIPVEASNMKTGTFGYWIAPLV